jgi:hypothetical protein
VSAGRRRRATAAAALRLAAVAAIGLACASLRTTPTTAAGAGELPSSERLRRLLAAHPGLRPVVTQARRHRLQVVVGLLVPAADGRQRLQQEGYRAGEEYLYPASTVKLFAAVAALERLAELRADTGLPVDADTPLVFHPLFPGEQREETDASHLAGGRITVRHEIRKLFLISDNAAFNRLFELVGPDRLAASVARAGLDGVRIVHRLSEPRSAEENRRLPRIDLVGEGFTHTLPARTAAALPPPPPLRGLRIGRAYLAPEGRIGRAMDFTDKNRAPLATLQRALCMVLLPDADCGGRGFALGEADRALLRQAMGELPRESADPRLDPGEHPDEEVKFLLPGLRRVVPADRLRVYDKSGQAYGFTLDNAWVVDQRSGGGYFLAAALYTNADGVLNDDAYDYESVALPFLADLAAAVARERWEVGGG